MNIRPKQEGQATVASRASQYSHCGASVDVDAPHIGQLSVSASIERILAGDFEARLSDYACAILAAKFGKGKTYAQTCHNSVRFARCSSSYGRRCEQRK
jgi:hypothetical protein